MAETSSRREAVAIRTKGHSDAVFKLVFSPNNKFLASLAMDRKVKLWKTATGNLHKTVGYDEDHIRDVIFSPDGSVIATVSEPSDEDDRATVRLWDTTTGERRGKYTHTGHLKGGAMPDYVKKYANHRYLERRPTNHNSMEVRGITIMAFSPVLTKRVLIYAFSDGTLWLWHTDSDSRPRRLKGRHSEKIEKLAFSWDGRTVASASRDHTIKLWKVRSWARREELRQTLEGHSGPVLAVAFTRGGTMLASSSTDATVRLWMVDSMKSWYPLKEIDTRGTCVISDLAFTPDGNRLAGTSYVGEDKKIVIWETSKWKRYSKCWKIIRIEGGVGTIAIDGDGPSIRTDRGQLNVPNLLASDNGDIKAAEEPTYGWPFVAYEWISSGHMPTQEELYCQCWAVGGRAMGIGDGEGRVFIFLCATKPVETHTLKNGTAVLANAGIGGPRDNRRNAPKPPNHDGSYRASDSHSP